MGPVIRTTSSIDGTIEMFRTDPGTWVSMTRTTTWKYNTRKYFWYLNGYIYCTKYRLGSNKNGSNI
jgi:hypothetical protein